MDRMKRYKIGRRHPWSWSSSCDGRWGACGLRPQMRLPITSHVTPFASFVVFAAIWSKVVQPCCIRADPEHKHSNPCEGRGKLAEAVGAFTAHLLSKWTTDQFFPSGNAYTWSSQGAPSFFCILLGPFKIWALTSSLWNSCVWGNTDSCWM